MTLAARREMQSSSDAHSGPGRTRLLVSVRDVAEARLAIEAGVDLLDVKEPRRGSLGAADATVLREILACTPAQLPVSAALGELDEARPGDLPAGVAFAKFGLAGCADRPDWADDWRRAVDALPPCTAPVSVVYADATSAAAPPAEVVVSIARAAGCRYVLVDTFDKSHGGLLDHWSLRRVANWLDALRAQQLCAVLAGSLTARCIERLLPLRPDVLAVRGAVCAGDRQKSIDAARIQKIVAIVRGSTARECRATG